jgi:heme/copper-type cytochrome/quinol oxidase subunit 2
MFPDLYFGVLASTAFFALIVAFFVVYFAIKYRDDAGGRVGAPAGWMPLELGWSLIPFFISISIFVWASIVLVHIAGGADQTLEIYSTGIAGAGQNTSPK